MDLDPTVDKLNSMFDGFLAILPNVVVAIVVFIALYILARVLRQTVRRVVRRSGGSNYAGTISGRATQWFTLILAVLVALSIVFPSLDAQSLVSILGIGGLAIGFAFRDIAQNFLAGILVLLTRPFQIGDQIVINEFEGTVEDIMTRATAIRTYDGRMVIIPNADLLTESVIVNTAHDIRRAQYEVGIGYEDDIDLAKRIILDAMDGLDEVLKQPAPDVLTVELSDSSVNLRVRWWTDSTRSSIVRTSDQVITSTKKALDASGINIPFPIRTVYFNDETEQLESNRPA